MSRTVPTSLWGAALLLAMVALAASVPGDGGAALHTLRLTVGASLVVLTLMAWLAARREAAPPVAPAEASPVARRFVLFQCIEDVREEVAPLAERKGVQLQVEYVTSMPVSVEGDRDGLRDALGDVLRAAIHATRKGTVLLLVYCWRERAEMHLELVVVDAGSGLAPTALREMFRHWESVDAAEDLRRIDAARESLRQAGGSLDMRHWPGVGTVYLLELPGGPDGDVTFFERPRRPDAAAPAAPAGFVAPAGGPDLAGRRILVIDDAVVNRRLLEGLLVGWGAAVTLVESGTEAVGRFDGGAWSASSFDAILCDVQMPGLDGFETVAWLRRHGFRRPIVAVTAAPLRDGRNTCVEAGFDDYVPKPVQAGLLGALLERLLEEFAPETGAPRPRDEA